MSVTDISDVPRVAETEEQADGSVNTWYQTRQVKSYQRDTFHGLTLSELPHDELPVCLITGLDGLSVFFDEVALVLLCVQIHLWSFHFKSCSDL